MDSADRPGFANRLRPKADFGGSRGYTGCGRRVVRRISVMPRCTAHVVSSLIRIDRLKFQIDTDSLSPHETALLIFGSILVLIRRSAVARPLHRLQRAVSGMIEPRPARLNAYDNAIILLAS